MRWRTVIVILVVTVVYAVLGGVFLHLIESGHEHQMKDKAYQELMNFMDDNPCVNLSTLRALSTLLSTASAAGLDAIPGANNLTYNTNWDLSSSIFLAFQVIGSVGYGNAPPRTTGGRVFCMFFALIGIPLLITGALGIGYIMLSVAERLRKLCLRHAGPKDAIKVHVLRTLILFVAILILFVVIPAGILTALEKQWNYGDAIYFCLNSVLSIGFSDLLPGDDWSSDLRNIYRLGVGCWLIISLLMFAALWSTVQLSISANKEMSEPLPDHFDGFLPPGGVKQLATNIRRVPENVIAYIPRLNRPQSLFPKSVPASFDTPNPHVVNRGGPLYNIPVAQGEVTQVEVRY